MPFDRRLPFGNAGTLKPGSPFVFCKCARDGNRSIVAHNWIGKGYRGEDIFYSVIGDGMTMQIVTEPALLRMIIHPANKTVKLRIVEVMGKQGTDYEVRSSLRAERINIGCLKAY